jgi:hypothetical protein
MRRLAVLGTIAVALAVAGPAAAQTVPRHVHSITTPAGTHEFGAGVSHHAPCVAFVNLHMNVHLGAFGPNPNGVSIQLIPGVPACEM